MADIENRLRMAIIAGAAAAVQFKEKNWKASEAEVVRHVTENVQDILDKIDNPL